MSGIYIHIPFCRQKCHYCNFFSLASQKRKEPFLAALKQEITGRRDYLGGDVVNTIYFGGGTPSLFRPEALQEVMEMLVPAASDRKAPGSSPDDATGEAEREFTLELNPDDVTPEYVAALKNTWFNRFSIGIQSFSGDDLKYLNRTHSPEQSIRVVKLLQDAGYGNISIDLIYGIPSSPAGRWHQNLETAFSLNVPHISAYALTVEEKTPLAWMIDRKKSLPVSDESQEQQFRWLMEQARANGYLQYEISNFCKPGRHALHNTNYWRGIPYLGLGPSAHSYNATSRRWNVANLSKYIDGLSSGDCIFEEELLTPQQKYNEYVMTSLRTMWGCDGNKIIDDFGLTMYDLFRKGAGPMIERGLVRVTGEVYSLSDEGKLFADRIASELFSSEEA